MIADRIGSRRTMIGCCLLYLSAGEKDARKCFGTYDSLSQTALLLSALVYSLCIGENYRLAGLFNCFMRKKGA